MPYVVKYFIGILLFNVNTAMINDVNHQIGAI